jgi:phenylacetic acid degradation operon negative regulatory protein
LKGLGARYRRFVREVDALRPRSERDVFVANTTLVHEWRRFPYLDPGLPIEYLPNRWIGREAKALFDERHARWRRRAGSWFMTLDRAGGEDNA